MDVLKVFSHNVRMYRIRLGLSQEAVAVRTGLHRTYISAVERGKRSISLDNIQRIADALEIETYLLFIDDTITPELEHRKSGYVERKRRPYQGNVVRIA